MKNILIITYYWPPAGGAGVQRVLKFAKYLPQFGFRPIILTVPKPDSPVDDETLLKDIPTEAKVYKISGFEPFSLYKKFTGKKIDEKIPADILQKSSKSIKEKLASWIRFNVFIPDAKIGWYFRAVKYGLEIIQKERIDIIFSSGPPHTTALIAKKLAKITRIKWVADFRDPWLEIVYYQQIKRNRITLAIDKHLEKSVLRQADFVTTVSEDIKLLLLEKGAKVVKVIENGFDESDFGFSASERNTKNEYFTIAYTGGMSVDRVPFTFLQILPRFVDEISSQIRFVFAGKFCSEFVNEINRLKISYLFEIQNFVTHQESITILQNSDALLLVVNNVQNNLGIVTGKMYEYLAAKKPILAIAPTKGDASKILTETKSGKSIDYSDEEETFNLLSEFYSNWKEGKNTFSFDSNYHTRKNKTAELSQIFMELLK